MVQADSTHVQPHSSTSTKFHLWLHSAPPIAQHCNGKNIFMIRFDVRVFRAILQSNIDTVTYARLFGISTWQRDSLRCVRAVVSDADELCCAKTDNSDMWFSNKIKLTTCIRNVITLRLSIMVCLVIINTNAFMTRSLKSTRCHIQQQPRVDMAIRRTEREHVGSGLLLLWHFDAEPEIKDTIKAWHRQYDCTHQPRSIKKNYMFIDRNNILCALRGALLHA